MIVKEELLKKLKAAFDLNIYEVKIWTALLSRGLATAGELSDISNVPRSRSYDVLESLEKKGFVMMNLGKPIRYLAVKPEDILKRLKDHIQERAETKMNILENVRGDAIFSELELLYKQGIKKVDPTSLSSAFRGRDNIYAQLRSMLERSEKSVVIMTSQQGLARKAKRFKSLFSKLANRGVSIKIAAPMPIGVNKDLNEIKNYIKLKPVSKINARMVIIDDKEVLFMVADDSGVHESYDTAIWVNTPYFTRALGSLVQGVFNGN